MHTIVPREENKMTNLNLKKEIERITKYEDSFKISVSLNHGDGCYHEVGEEVIYWAIELYNEDGERIGDCIDGSDTMIENETNLKQINKDIKAVVKYLSKHFNNIEQVEMSI